MTNDQATEILSRLRWSEFELGFPESETLSSPGVVLLCCEVASDTIGETHFEILAMFNANNNALEVAKGLLAQKKSECRTRLYARIAPTQSLSERELACQAAQQLRKKGTH